MSHAPDTRFAVLYDDGSMNVGQAGQTVEHAEAQRAWDGDLVSSIVRVNVDVIETVRGARPAPKAARP